MERDTIEQELTPRQRLNAIIENYSILQGRLRSLNLQYADPEDVPALDRSFKSAIKVVSMAADSVTDQKLEASKETLDALETIIKARLETEPPTDPFFVDFVFAFPATLWKALGTS